LKDQISRGLSITLLIYTIYSVVYGLLHVISPELVGAKDPAIERVLGAAVLAFAMGAGLAFREKTWKKVKIAVLIQVAWMILYTLMMVWGLLMGEITSMAWAPAIIGAIFAVLLTVFYIQEAKVTR
jgi:membrane associated rhomboid family serine protease